MTPKEMLSLPNRIDSWTEIKELKNGQEYMLAKKATWNCKNEMTEAALTMFLDYLEDEKPLPKYLSGFENSIECFVGWIKVFRNTIVVSHFPEHKYGNMHYPELAKRIIKINRAIAKRTGSEEIIYCPDSAFPTAIIEEYALEGKNFETIKKLAIEQFGNPPKGIGEGRKYMFFIDNIHDDIGNLTEWKDWEGYWKYNQETGNYELKKGDSR